MFDHSPISAAGRLVVWSWRRIAKLHRNLRARRRPRIPPPLLVVGSARSGGTCKTDLVSWIAGQHPELAILCHATGDEDRWLRQRHPGRVFAHRDWLEAWRLAQRRGFAAAVCDGGLQDPALDGCLALRLDVEPLPASWKDFHPWGAWRESPADAREATGIRVVEELRPGLHLDRTFDAAPRRAACAIARPEAFFADLEAAGIELVERVACRDHSRFPKPLLRRMAAKPTEWVVTEKDAARTGIPAGVGVAQRRLNPSPSIRTRIEAMVRSISLARTGSP